MYQAFRFGVRVLREHTVPPEVVDQLNKRTHYWNQLVELDRGYRRTMDELVAPHLSKDGTDEEQQQARKATLKRPEIQMALKAAQTEVYSAQRQYRGASGLYWGSYLEVEQSWATARQRNPRQMCLQRPSGLDGTLSVHFQDGGMPIAKLWGDNNLLQLTAPPEGVYEAARSVRRKACWVPFRFRVASTPDRQPVWFEAVVCLHRPLPTEGIVRRAHLVVGRYRALPYPRYWLVVVVEQEAPPPTDSRRVWGLDVGWRRVEAGMRVAVAWERDSGEVRQLMLPERLLGAFDWADRRRAGRDLQQNSIRAALIQYREACRAHLPGWHREQLSNVGQWNSPGRFRWLYHHWARHDGDEDIFARLEGWEKQDRHLAGCVRGAQQRASAWRENLYGTFWTRLLADAEVVAVEDVNWRELSQQVEEYGEQGQQRRIASVGWLLEHLGQAAAREGVRVERVPAENTTRRCSWCGTLNDGGEALYQVCGGCGRTYDQDLNAARNLAETIASGQEMQGASRDRSQKPARWKRIQDAVASANG